MTRIHIGEKNGRMGFWIAPPGGDASGEGKMLVSSDLDYLKLHAFGKLRVNGLWDDVDGGYGYNETPVLFPALPYRPLIFVSFQWENEWIEYPMSTNPSHWEFDDHIPTGVETDRIVLFKGGAASGRYKPYVDVSYQVFKNKLAAAQMADRIILGQQGSMFVARVSRAGFDVNTANADEFLFREDTISLRPKQSGSFAFGGSGSQQIPIGGHTDPPVVVLKSSDNTTPCRFNYYAEVSPDLNTFRVVNSGGARTIFYYIFGGSIAQPQPLGQCACG